MPQPLLTCGCRAHATQTLADGSRVPSCVVHGCHEVAPEPDLAGRMARCSCGAERPSDGSGLAFFEYLGPGSRQAREICGVCRYAEVAHVPRPCPRCDGSGTYRWGTPPVDRDHLATPGPCSRCDGSGMLAPAAFLRGAGGHGPHDFTPLGGLDHDRFYCGCRGWD